MGITDGVDGSRNTFFLKRGDGSGKLKSFQCRDLTVSCVHCENPQKYSPQLKMGYQLARTTGSWHSKLTGHTSDSG